LGKSSPTSTDKEEKMSVRQFLNSRMGFAGAATLLCGTGFFLGMGLKEDARLRKERAAALEILIEQRVNERLRRDQENVAQDNVGISKSTG
jgi:hypothetical protein